MSTDSDFRAQLESRIKRFVAERDDVRKHLVELNHALNAIEKRLETAAEMYRLEFGTDPPSIGSSEAPTSRARRSGESWNAAVQAVLTEATEPLHITEIWRRVQERGFTTTAKDPLRAIASVLVRHPDAVRTSPNTYALAETDGASPSSPQQTLVPVAGRTTGTPTSGEDE